MANNLISFNRFTGVDPNLVANAGATIEEIQLQHGAPEADPVHSPMANPAVSAVRLALVPTGSDQMRLAGPEQPIVNPFEGPKMLLVLSRNATIKLRGRIVGDLKRLVQQGAVAEGNLKQLMIDSMRRVDGMREFVTHLNVMAETVIVNSLAAAKG